MPAQGVVTIVLGALLAATLVAAVSVILVQLLRTSAVLADVDTELAQLPRRLAGLDRVIGRINRALQSLAS
jgi:hypothetical protein